jgi:peptide subunit release factor 1 (eRF1)
MTMDQQLQSLLDYQGDKVLSVYLDTDLANQSKEAVRLTFRRRAAELEQAAPEEVGAVQRFLDFEYDWQSRGVAIFASGDDLWEVIPLPIPPRTRVTYTARPHVRMLTDIGDRLGKYDVAVLDRERLRLFSVAWGKIQSETEAVGEELKRHKQGGWSATIYQRREDNLAVRNLRQAIEVMQQFTERTGNRRLMLGGSPEALAQVRELMPKPLLEQIIGEFVVDVGAKPNEILGLSLDLAQEVDLANERDLVEQAIAEAAKGGYGVTGLTDTLFALHQGQVRLLLVDESYHVSGFLCRDCGSALTERRDQCPLCRGKHLEETHDVVNVSIHKAAETGAEVNIVRENAELLRVGGIAALTRY